MNPLTVEAILLVFYVALFLGNYLGMGLFLGLNLFSQPPQRLHVQPLEKPNLARKLASQFKPIIQQPRNLRSQPPTEIWYEIVPIDSRYYIINYRVRWPSEIHPNPVVDALYRFFRTFFYGSSEDMEIIQLMVDLKQMKVIQIKFETDTSNDPDVFISDHAKVTLKKINDNFFEIWTKNRKIGRTTIQFQNERPVIEVLTWNHVFAINYSNNRCDLHDLPLKPLTNYHYRRYRLDRRSNFDDIDETIGNKSMRKSKKIMLTESIFISQLTILVLSILACLLD